jgi:type IV pilus assembly protein PilA
MRFGRARHHPPGFTLLELLMVLGILGMLASVVILAINPTKQIGDVKDAQRLADLRAILDAVNQFQIKRWRLPQLNGAEAILLETNPASKQICRYDATDVSYIWCHNFNARYLGELVPDYLSEIPIDPDHDAADTWGTDYFIWKDADGRITVRSSLYDNGAGIERKL